MKTIFKFPILKVDDIVEIEMPKGAQIISVQCAASLAPNSDKPAIWAIVDTEAPKAKRRIRIAGTGHPLESQANAYTFIGTLQLYSGRLVFHFFDLGEI